jgi:DNA-binding NarL/FixJ family response regulator
VVLDVELQDGTGLQVLDRVRTISTDTHFVVCTNCIGGPYRQRYLATGARALLDKSTDCDQLPAAITAVRRR